MGRQRSDENMVLGGRHRASERRVPGLGQLQEEEVEQHRAHA